MKFSLTFKTPDVLDQALEELEYDPYTQCDCGGCCVDCERMGEQAQMDQREIRMLAKQFVRYGEYLTVDFDSVAGTATVRKQP